MKLKAWIAGSALLGSALAWAEDTASAPSSQPLIANDSDRFFPLTESAAVPSAFVRAHTTGSAGSSNAFSVGQSVEIVPLQRLSVRATAEFALQTGFTPSAQAKYQLLEQATANVNLSAGLRYKQQGFLGTRGEGETEAFVSVGRSFGRFVATANLVGGLNVADPKEGDWETHLSLGYQPIDKLMVGVSGRYRQAFGPDAEFFPDERRFELIAGPVVGYALGLVDVSLQYGLYVPRGVNLPAGQMGVLGVNLNF